MSDGGHLVDSPVPPGTWLTLDLTIEPTAELPRTGLALLVHRADGLLVFDGNSMLDGEPPRDLAPGRPWHLSVKFRTNVLRGTYAVSGHLFEESRRWRPVQLGVLGSFIVAETTRAGGIADLEPQYRTLDSPGL